MKKFLVAVMAGSMMLAVAACSSKDSTKEETTSVAVQSQDETQDQTLDQTSDEVYFSNPAVETPEQAVEVLKDGNARFVSGNFENFDLGDTKRTELTEGQSPYAVVVTCSDSRVVPEYSFDQGLGDIFVIRVAGNVLDLDEMASIEYAVEHTGSKLVVFLGHQSCGAVTAAVEAEENGTDETDTKNQTINALLAKIQPSVEAAKAEGASGDELLNKAIELNAEAGVTKLQEDSEIIKEGVDAGTVKVVAAEYMLDSGEVIWFE